MKTANGTEVERFEAVLADFERPLSELLREPQKSLLEIAGFPRRETVYSNILAYFLDPNEQHGLGDLFANALLSAAGFREVCTNPRSTKVEREEGDDSGKRIDIVVDEDSFVIGIENKIDAGLNNDFHAYYQDLKKRLMDGR